MLKLLWPISSPRAYSDSRKNSARFCGSYRPAFVWIQNDYGSSLTCCHVTPGRRLIWRRSTMSGCTVGRGRRLTARDRSATRSKFDIRRLNRGEFIALLREHDIAMVVADTARKWPLIENSTSDFVYVRLHGDQELYVSGYTPEALGMWGRKMRAWAKGKTPTGAADFSQIMDGARMEWPPISRRWREQLEL